MKDKGFARALAAIDEAAGALDVAAIARPVSGRWSIAEILEHLTLAFKANAVALEKPLVSGELRARKPDLKQRFFRTLVIRFGYFPRVEAPEVTRPSGTIPPERSLAALRDALTTLDAMLTRVAARFGEDVPVTNHPYFAGLTVRQWRAFHCRHTLHHMQQVRERARYQSA